MKNLLINALIYFVLLSILVAFIALLTGIDGSTIIGRIIVAFILAYFKPFIIK
jgi:hypothetical protein